MNYKKFVFTNLLICLFSITNALKSQGLQFDNNIYDFGDFEESSIPEDHEFWFTNIGSTPLVIKSVAASCGCTTPHWSADTVKPGARGQVKASYDSKNRVGDFNKSIEVFYNDGKDRSQSLTIKGNVIMPKKVVPIQALLDYGNFTLDRMVYENKNLLDNKIDTFKLRFFNSGNVPIEASLKYALPSYMWLSAKSIKVGPQESAIFEVYVDCSKIERYGLGQQGLTFESSHVVNRELSAEIKWIRKQYFPKMSARKLKKQPHLQLSTTLIDFGKYDDGLIKTDTLTLKNTGKKDLVFHEILPLCHCIILRYPKSVLKPGEEMKMIVSFNPGGKFGSYTQPFWILCNDPQNPDTYVYVKNELPPRDKNCLSCPPKYKDK